MRVSNAPPGHPRNIHGRVVMDITGQVMDEQEIHNNTNAIFNVKDYTEGMYLYQVITNGKTQTGKILVER